MSELVQVRLIKIFIFIGLSLLVLGYYLLLYVDLPTKMGVTGIIICACCIAFGLLFSLPTKLYLTLLLMSREREYQQKLTANKKTEK
jgi:pilus assembly protein TadC